MKKLIILLFILTSFFAKAQVTMQFNAPNPGTSHLDSIRYIYSGKFGGFDYLLNAYTIRNLFLAKADSNIRKGYITLDYFNAHSGGGGAYWPLAGNGTLTATNYINTGNQILIIGNNTSNNYFSIRNASGVNAQAFLISKGTDYVGSIAEHSGNVGFARTELSTGHEQSIGIGYNAIGSDSTKMIVRDEKNGKGLELDSTSADTSKFTNWSYITKQWVRDHAGIAIDTTNLLHLNNYASQTINGDIINNGNFASTTTQHTLSANNGDLHFDGHTNNALDLNTGGFQVTTLNGGYFHVDSHTFQLYLDGGSSSGQGLSMDSVRNRLYDATGNIMYLMASDTTSLIPTKAWVLANGGGGSSFYQTFKNQGSSLTQRSNANFTYGLIAADNSPNTDVKADSTVLKSKASAAADYANLITGLGTKQAALGFTAENVANKTATASTSTTTYPNWLGIENYFINNKTFYNILTYGGVRDSTADNTTAINAAIAAMPANGGTLYFPTGVYRLSHSITILKPITILGDGMNGGVGVPYSPNKSATKIAFTIADSAAFKVNSPAFNIYNLDIISAVSPSAGSTPFKFNNAGKILINHVSSANFYDGARIESGTFEYLINDYHLDKVHRYGLFLDNSTLADYADQSITNCIIRPFDSTAVAAFYIQGGGGARIIGNKINSGAGSASNRFIKGIYINNTSGTTSVLNITANSFENINNEIIYQSSGTAYGKIQITGNEFLSQSNSNLIDFEGTMFYGTISGNTIASQTALSGSNYAIKLGSGTGYIKIGVNDYANVPTANIISDAGSNNQITDLTTFGTDGSIGVANLPTNGVVQTSGSIGKLIVGNVNLASQVTGLLPDGNISSASTWSAKQAALISATNIKSINSASILASGNINLQTPLTAGMDYLAPNGSAALLTSFPTLNQNSTGSSAKWTTARNLAGNSVDGSANVAFANKFIVQGTSDAGLSNAQFLGALSTGILKVTTSTGVLSDAVAGTDYTSPTGTETLTNKTLTNAIVGTQTALDNSTKAASTAYADALKSATATLTNKRITKRIGAVTSSSTPTPDGDNNDVFEVTALAANATFAAPTGTPTDGQPLLIRVKDNGTARTLAWNAIYRAGTDIALPTTTVISKTMYLQFAYNAADSKWDFIGLTTGF